MAQDEEASENTHLLSPRVAELSSQRRSTQPPDDLDEASSIISSHVSNEEQELAGTAVGERLPYNDYTTIDWLHDLVRPIESQEEFHVDGFFRSRTHFDTVLSTPGKVSRDASSLAGINVKDG
jgi:hypothetical protein